MSFITGSVFEKLHDDAKTQSEFATKKLWNHWLRHRVFTDESWVVGPEQPPRAYDDLRRIDILVEYHSAGFLNVFSVGELKSGKAAKQDIVTVESQAYEKCNAVLSDSGRDAVWAMTMYGACARLWVCRRGRAHLYPIYPSDESFGKREHYLDILPHEQAFQSWLLELMRVPTPNKDSAEFMLEWAAGNIIMAGNDHTYVKLYSSDKNYLWGHTSGGETVAFGKKWTRACILFDEQLWECYIPPGEQSSQYYSYDKSISK